MFLVVPLLLALFGWLPDSYARAAQPKTHDWRDGLGGVLFLLNFFTFLGGFAVGAVFDGWAMLNDKRLSLRGWLVVYPLTLGLTNLFVSVCYFLRL